jgi:uncharacterized protein (TIGR04255 family)
MPFPSSPRVIFQRNPLAEVVCELRFPPILRIASELPAAFQERIRQAYPNFQQPAGLMNPVQFQTPPGVGFTVGPSLNIGWPQPSFVFADEHQTRTLTLSQESFSIAERDYREWGIFREEIESLKGHLEDVYQPPFYTRVGLRYQDLIDRDELGLSDVSWADLLNPAFAGLLGAETQVSQDVQRITSVAELLVPEVPGGRVRVQHGLIEAPAPIRYAIDSDFSVAERSDLAEVLPRLDAFSAHAGNLFRWAVSDRLLTALQPAPPPASEHHAA